MSPVHRSTTSLAYCQDAASVSSRLSGSTPSRNACSRTSRPANAWYVEISGSPSASSSPGASPTATSRRSRRRTRSASSPAALRVKVSPSTWSGRVWPLATSQITRAAIVSVLPDPAPATTSTGPGGASMTATCSGVGGCWPIARAMSAAPTSPGNIWPSGAPRRPVLTRSPAGPRAAPGS